jgi:hypothetical protein
MRRTLTLFSFESCQILDSVISTEIDPWILESDPTECKITQARSILGNERRTRYTKIIEEALRLRPLEAIKPEGGIISRALKRRIRQFGLTKVLAVVRVHGEEYILRIH